MENRPQCIECGGAGNENFQCMFCVNKKHKILEIIEPENNVETYFKKLYNRILDGTSTESDEKNLLYFMNQDM